MITCCRAPDLAVVTSQAGPIQAASNIVAAIVVVPNIAGTGVTVANVAGTSVVASNIATATVVVVAIVSTATGAAAGGVNRAVSSCPDCACTQSHAP